MKKMYWLVAAGMMLATLSTIQRSFAQDTGSENTSLRSMSPDQVVDSLATKLNLTDEQKSQIKPIIEERRQNLADLKADMSMRRRQKMRKMKSIVKDSDKKIEAVLNPQQKEQYIQIEQEMREKMRERRQGVSQ